jgi:hypothetical protein
MRIGLPIMMAMGPRWNTHAIVASAGPVRIKRSLGIRVDAAERSAKLWSIVICTFPGMQTVTSIGSTNSPFHKDVVTIDLKPGTYWLAVRYYQWSDNIELPSVIIDDVETIKTARIPPDINAFHRTLVHRTNWLYRSMHYYVFVLLQYKTWFPQSFVEKEFLPLGNPETHFCYGALNGGEFLRLELRPELLPDYSVYLTLYNRASLPLEWYSIETETHETAETGCDCMYLVRVHARRPVQRQLDPGWIKVTVSQRTAASSPMVRYALHG